MARIGGRVVPQELELMGDEGADHLRHLGGLRGEIAQILDRLQEHGPAMAIDIATAGVHQHTFRWRQQKLLGQFFVGIGDLEARIIALHTHLAAMNGDDFPKRKEPVASAIHQGEKYRMVGDSTVEVLVQKGKPAGAP
jgi:hypothetical protein